MSRGLGKLQRQIIHVLATYGAEWDYELGIKRLKMEIWEDVPVYKEAYNSEGRLVRLKVGSRQPGHRGNFYRALHALQARGLLTSKVEHEYAGGPLRYLFQLTDSGISEYKHSVLT